MIALLFSLLSGITFAAESVAVPVANLAAATQKYINENTPIILYRMSERGGREPDTYILGIQDTDQQSNVIIGIKSGVPIFATDQSLHGNQSLEIQSQSSSTPTPTPTPLVPIVIKVTPQPTPLPTPAPREARMSNVTIAILGDSMVDTLGKDLPELRSKLEATYPKTSFTLYNYGVGASNIEYGIKRITQDYEYLGVNIPSLASRKPDIVIIESFGYNPFPQDDGALERHWLALAHAVDTVRASVPEARVMIAATVAPNATVFGDGAPAVSFGNRDKEECVATIKKYIENAIKFARSQRLPLADAYTPSLLVDGNGNLAYIDAGDHIHPSPAGRKLFADVVVQTMVRAKLIE